MGEIGKACGMNHDDVQFTILGNAPNLLSSTSATPSPLVVVSEKKNTERQRSFMGRLRSGIRTRERWENVSLKRRALECVPQELRTPSDDEVARTRRLLHWFKNDFFTWVNSPPCDKCGGTKMVALGSAAPSTELEIRGDASRVEIYRCEACGTHVRFPRINSPQVLLETRRGRCGEWANCFGAVAVACGFEARYVLDWTDHVWVEILLNFRWMHADPCENALDSPLMYSKGWGKTLSYVFAFSPQAVVDVTRRYVERLQDAERSLCSETRIKELTHAAVAQESFRASTIRDKCVLLLERYEEFGRRRREDAANDVDEGGEKSNVQEELGRESGSVEWKKRRGEENSPLDVLIRKNARKTLKLLSRAVERVVEDPSEPKYRRIRVSKMVSKVDEGDLAISAFVRDFGFRESRRDGVAFLELDDEATSRESSSFVSGMKRLQNWNATH